MAQEAQSAAGAQSAVEIDPVNLRQMRQDQVRHLVVDVREQWELEIASLPDSLHLPLGDLPARYTELPKDRPLVVLCRTGRRSLQATMWLRAQGYGNAVNLRGGVHLWSDQVDPTMRKY
ncbi:MAG: sulfurtransferase [Alphaproteobacteria bacterium]|nr:sulfurtransferase [Alphaproteobacteria bacterium]